MEAIDLKGVKCELRTVNHDRAHREIRWACYKLLKNKAFPWLEGAPPYTWESLVSHSLTHRFSTSFPHFTQLRG